MIRIEVVNGLKLACWVNRREWQAANKTLVFLHGSGGDHSVWLHQCAAFRHSFNIAALDLPGHGRSEGRGEQDIAAYVEWVRRIIGGMAVASPVMIGHSLGAAVALAYALTYGDSLAGIVPVGGGAAMPVNQAILDGLKTDPEIVIALAAKIALAKSNRDRLSDTLTKSMSAVNPDVLYGDFLACAGHDMTAAVSRIRVPTLVICGEEDKMTPVAMSQHLKDNIPGARLALISNAGHFAMLENVEEFNRSLGTFVESLP
jgi:pimeloyl-ACP methyl ester carboxylesterase